MISEEQIRYYNKTLEPNLWDENQNLKPEIRLDLLKIAQDFYKSTDFKSQFLDILLLGSSVNYTWTPESDIDVHIVIDITKEGLDPEHYRKSLDSISGHFNLEHDIRIHNHKVEVYLQDITEKNSTPERVRKHGAMFSLLHDKWLVTPKYEKPTLDKDAIKKAFYKIRDKIEHIIEKRDVEALKTLMKSIRDYRNKGMESDAGEFSTENIVFKALRHTGLLEKLKIAINSMYDRMVSIEEMESYLNKINNLDEDIIQEFINETLQDLEERDKAYILIGATDEMGRVAVLKVEKIRQAGMQLQPYKTHRMLDLGNYNIDPNTALEWRYRSDINELGYKEYPSEKQSTATKEHLRTHYKVEMPKVMVARSLSKQLHDLDYKPPMNERKFTEMPPSSENFIVTGMISHDLDIASEVYWGTGDIINHEMLKDWYGKWNDSIDWRYRKDENTVFYKEHEPSELQKEIITDHLKEEYDVESKPKFEPMMSSNKVLAHFPKYYGPEPEPIAQ